MIQHHRSCANDTPTILHQQFDIIDEGRSCAGRGCKTRNHIPLPASQQLIHGNIEGFPCDVIKSNIDRALRSKENTSSFEILTSVKFLPYPADLHGILANQELTKVLQ